MTRKIIQTIVFGDSLLALSDDGLLWLQSKGSNAASYWSPLPALPQIPLEQLPVGELRGNGAASEQRKVDSLVIEELMDGQSSGGAEHDEDSVATASARSVTPKTPPSRSAPHEKLAPPPPKTKPKQARDDKDAEPRVAVKYLFILAGIAVFALTTYWLFLRDTTLTPDGLVAIALKGSKTEERQGAVGDLIARKQIPLLQRVAKESTDPEVVVQAINGLGILNDTSSMPFLIASLDHSEKRVRETAGIVLQRFFGGTLPENIEYKADDPPDVRSHAAKQLKEYFDKPPRYLSGK